MLNFVKAFLVAGFVFFSLSSLAAQGDFKAQCMQCNSEAECQSQGVCSWDSGKQMCEASFGITALSCEQITCPCKCTSNNGCEWNTANRRCESLR